MNPEERLLLERTLKLSEENNVILRKFQRQARWAFVWGFIKVALILVPLIAGYLFLQPYLDQATTDYGGIKDVLSNYQSLLQ